MINEQGTHVKMKENFECDCGDRILTLQYTVDECCNRKSPNPDGHEQCQFNFINAFERLRNLVTT